MGVTVPGQGAAYLLPSPRVVGFVGLLSFCYFSASLDSNRLAVRGRHSPHYEGSCASLGHLLAIMGLEAGHRGADFKAVSVKGADRRRATILERPSLLLWLAYRQTSDLYIG